MEELTRLDATLVASVSSGAPNGFARQNEIKGKIKATEALLRVLESQTPEDLQQAEEFGPRVRTASYSELREILRREEALVVIVSGTDASFAFAASREQLRWVRLDIGAYAIERMTATLRCGLDLQQWGEQGHRRCEELTGAGARPLKLPFRLDVAHELYRVLFGPIEDALAGKQLVLTLSGPLASLPPQALVTAAPAAALPPTFDGYRGVAWFGREHAISVLPSVASLLSLRRNAARAHAPEPYFGLGDPVLSGNPSCQKIIVPKSCPRSAVQVAENSRRSGVDGSAAVRDYSRGPLADVTALRQLCPLPDSALELQCVAKSVGASPKDLLRGRDLTVGAVKRARLDRYRILHFATHGLLAGQTERYLSQTSEPALVMTPPSSSTPEDSGLLTASDIAQLKLNADWVVLSACNTAAGERISGEALAGLARAFFYAGARTLLVSHWAVVSGVAVLLTNRAFEEMEHDSAIGPAESMRRSMVALMDQAQKPAFAHPQFWAAFVVVGEGGPFAASPQSAH
jgi:CHAT domain-containing protein